MIKKLKFLYLLFSPYFGKSGVALKRSLAVISIILCYAIASYSLMYVQASFSVLDTILMSGNIALPSVFHALTNSLIPLCIFALSTCTSFMLTSWLSNNLYHAIKKSFISKWMTHKAYNGIQYIEKDGKKTSPAMILTNDLRNICSNSIYLLSSFFQSALNFVMCSYQLWRYSYPFVFYLSAYSITIPAPMFLAAITYSIVFAFIITKLESKFKKISKKIMNKDDSLSEHMHHIHENSESIALKNGDDFEKRKLLKILDVIYKLQISKLLISSSLSLLETTRSHITQLFGFILALPSVMSGKLGPSHIFSVAHYFNTVVDFFCWWKINSEAISETEASIDRLSSFQDLIKEWERVRANNQVEIINHQESLGLDAFSASTPKGENIFKNVKINIPAGEATLIQGKSGIGKSTLLRCLTNLWPYSKGQISLPSSGVFFIPQRAYFPRNSTLLDVITYPRKHDPKDKDKIILLMKELGLHERIIKNIEKKYDWGTTLSGGEQQRIAIIGAIVKNPDILFIDEGISGLDAETRKSCENALKTHLKNKTIVAIDHHANMGTNNNFFENKLVLSKIDEKQAVTTSLSKFN